MKSVEQVEFLVEVVVGRVHPRLPSVLVRMDEWLGVFRSSTAGAGPGGGSVRVPDAPRPGEEEPVSVRDRPPTSTEVAALSPDAVSRDLAALDRSMVELQAALVEVLAMVVKGPLPSMVSRRPAARVASLVWLVRHLERVSVLPSAAGPVLRRAVGAASVVDRVVGAYWSRTERPSAGPVCRSHERAGLVAAPVGRYAGLRLCMWCGEFRAEHGAIPDVELVRLHDRGIRVTPSILVEHEQRKRDAENRRRRERRAAKRGRRPVSPGPG